MTALRGLAILLLLQTAGEALAHTFGLLVPGPVLGLMLLLLALQARWVRAPIQAGAELLLAHLSLFFVPIGVGVITHLDLVTVYGVRLMAVIVLPLRRVPATGTTWHVPGCGSGEASTPVCAELAISWQRESPSPIDTTPWASITVE